MNRVSSIDNHRSLRTLKSLESILCAHYDGVSSLHIGNLIMRLLSDARGGNEHAMKYLAELVCSSHEYWDHVIDSVCDDVNETIAKIYESSCDGRVYIARNSSMKGIYKIGYTKKDVGNRMTELSRATGVPTPFEEVFSVPIPNCREFERRLHTKLDQYRINKDREFFGCCLRKIITTMGIEGRSYLEEKGIDINVVMHAPWSESQIDIAVSMPCERNMCDCFED